MSLLDHYKAHERAALEAPSPGFWLAACMAGVCDQAIETHRERARFYPGTPPAALLDPLRSDAAQAGDNQPIALAGLFHEQALAELERQRPDCPFARRFIARGRQESYRIGFGVEFEPARGAQPPGCWGAVEFFSSDCDYLMEPEDDDYQNELSTLYGWRDNSEDIFRAASIYCEAALDALERSLGLSPSELRVFEGRLEQPPPEQYSGRPRWGKTALPEYLSEEFKPAALALMERESLRAVADPGASRASKPRV